MSDASVEVDVVAATSVISACETGQVWQSALLISQSTTQCGLPPDVVCRGATLSACEKGSQWSLAFHLGSIQGDAQSQSSHVQNSCLAASAKVAEWRAAIEMALSLQHKRGQLDVLSYGSVLHACDVSLRWQRAVHILSHMQTEGPHPNIVAFSSAISAVSASLRGGTWALRALAALSTSRLKANAICCNAAISACAASTLWSESIHVFGNMLRRGPAPTTVTHGAVMAVAERTGRWHDVLHLLSIGHHSGLRPSLVTCATSLAACRGDRGAWTHATHLFERCYKRYNGPLQTPTLVVANALIGAYSVAGRWQAALGVLDGLHGWMLQPDVLSLSTASSAVVGCREALGAWMQTLGLLSIFEASALQPDYASLDSMLSMCDRDRQPTSVILGMLQISATKALVDLVEMARALGACIPQHITAR